MLRGRVVENVTVELARGRAAASCRTARTTCMATERPAAAIILGLAPEVELVSIRVLGADLRGKGTAFAGGPRLGDRARACRSATSASRRRASRCYPIFHDLADRAYFRGMALVSAANNVPAPSYPSLFSSVFSVAAHGEPDPWRIYYNPAPPVEFGAWGVDVPIAWKDGGSTVATGNSFAAPHVAGLVALILSKHPGLSPFEVKAILASVADNPGGAIQAPPAGASGEPGSAPTSSSSAATRRWRGCSTGEFISGIGDWLYLVAILVVVYAESNSPVLLGIVGAARILPYVLLSVPAGIVADRFDRRMVLLVTDVARGLLMLVLAAAVMLDAPTTRDRRRSRSWRPASRPSSARPSPRCCRCWSTSATWGLRTAPGRRSTTSPSSSARRSPGHPARSAASRSRSCSTRSRSRIVAVVLWRLPVPRAAAPVVEDDGDGARGPATGLARARPAAARARSSSTRRRASSAGGSGS